MGEDELRRALEEARARVEALQAELEQTQRGVVEVTLELEQRVEERTEALERLRGEVEQREQAERELRRLSVSRSLVGRILRDVRAAGGLSGAAMFAAGRALAGRVPGETLADVLDAFAGLGLGSLRLEDEDPARRRWTFAGEDLVETLAESPRPTGEYTRGFLCGAVARVTGAAHVAGVEIACQSMGDERCRFVVQALDGGGEERS